MLPLPWRLTKPQTRQAWVGWVDDSRAARAEHFARVRAERAAGEQEDWSALREWGMRVQAAKDEAERTGQRCACPRRAGLR
jgi:hypothetical protein